MRSDIKKIIKVSIFFLVFFSLQESFASIGDYISYVNESDGYKLYQKSANDSSNGTAITSISGYYGISYSPDGEYIVYSAGSYIYKKSANDSSNGTAINSVSSSYPKYSPDGQYIVYVNNSDGGKLYQKSANDSSNGTAINSVYSRYPKYSPDGQYIVYVNESDGYKLYKKSANDSSNGTAINSVQSYYGFDFSPDGQYIVYVNISNGYLLYQKSANDSSNGTAINSVTAREGLSYSPDGQYIVYVNNSDGGKLYQKSANDSSNGTAINSVQSKNPDYNGILTQTFDYNGLTCTTSKTNTATDTTWYSGYSGTTKFTNSSLNEWVYYQDSNNWQSFQITDTVDSSSIISTGSLSWGSSNTTELYGKNDYDWTNSYTFGTYMVQNGSVHKINTIQIKQNENQLFGITKTCDFVLLKDKTTVEAEITFSGGIYTAYAPGSWDIALCYSIGNIQAIRLGYSQTAQTSETSCASTAYSCKWENSKCIYPYPWDLGDEANAEKCAIDTSNNYCVPISGTGYALPGQTEIKDASGAVIDTVWKVSNTDAKELFSCDSDKDGEVSWTEGITCLFSMGGNVIDYSDKGKSEIDKTTGKIGVTETDSGAITFSGNTNNMIGIINRKMNEKYSGDNNTSKFIKFIYWFIIIAVVGSSLILIYMVRKK